MLAPLQIQLAIAQHRYDVEALLRDAVPPPPAKNWWQLTTIATRLDALTVLGDAAAIEREAPTLSLRECTSNPLPFARSVLSATTTP
jgi:hypothetical protein